MGKHARFHGYVPVQPRGVVALPRDLRERLHLDDPGSQIELIEREDGVIEMRPHPVSQRWFSTTHWQDREREAEQDVSQDRLTRFDDVESFLVALPN